MIAGDSYYRRYPVLFLLDLGSESTVRFIKSTCKWQGASFHCARVALWYIGAVHRVRELIESRLSQWNEAQGISAIGAYTRIMHTHMRTAARRLARLNLRTRAI